MAEQYTHIVSGHYYGSAVARAGREILLGPWLAGLLLYVKVLGYSGQAKGLGRPKENWENLDVAVLAFCTSICLFGSSLPLTSSTRSTTHPPTSPISILLFHPHSPRHWKLASPFVTQALCSSSETPSSPRRYPTDRDRPLESASSLGSPCARGSRPLTDARPPAFSPFSGLCL
jgi:hypothetical protein